MRPIYLIGKVTLILIALIFTYSQSQQTTSGTGQTATRTTRSQPVKAKKVLVKALPKELRGVVLEKGMFKLQPGYKFVEQTNSTVAIAPSGGEISGTFSCSCFATKPSGSCTLTTLGGALSCNKAQKNPCNGECELAITIDGNKSRLAIY